MASFMRAKRIADRLRGSQAAVPQNSWEAVQNGPKPAQKCQRPRTEGARTSGAAEPFSGRPGAGAMKHRRRRWNKDRDDREVPQGRITPKPVSYTHLTLPTIYSV